jgi:hypothetical protein
MSIRSLVPTRFLRAVLSLISTRRPAPWRPHTAWRTAIGLALLLGASLSVRAARQPDASADPATVRLLTALNDDYIRFVQGSDVAGFEALLAPDFLCSNPDGSLVDRAGFLAQTARPVTVRNLKASDVRIRVFGDVAIIHARTTFTNADGSPGAGRYTDTYVRRNGRWQAVAAHVTRMPAPH